MQAGAKKPLRKVAFTLIVGAAAVIAIVAVIGRTATSHGAVPASLGNAAPMTALEAVVDQPGPVTVETVIGADWQVPLSGVLNLDHPEAKNAKLSDRDEPVYIAFHVVRHPTRGTFLVDTGVERALFERPDDAVIRGVPARVAHVEKLKRRTDTQSWIVLQKERIAGVFLTHLHFDHVSGMRDVPEGTPVYVGRDETTSRSFENFFVAPVVNRALEGKPALSVWQFGREADGAFEGILDVFGDGTFWAIHVPGHTAGSTAYLARTPSGSVLLTGDACHTVWGWDHGVEPGSFSSDKKRSAASLERLRRFAAKHPKLEVRLGHQKR